MNRAIDLLMCCEDFISFEVTDTCKICGARYDRAGRQLSAEVWEQGARSPLRQSVSRIRKWLRGS